MNQLKGFASDESGAVTVDWVALLATLVLIGIGCAVAINNQTLSYADQISGEIAKHDVWTF